MKLNLGALEVRVLGSLMEKELTTPENYPLSLNSLLSACNQKSNRDPMMTLAEADVQQALEGLRNRGLARLTTVGGRVARYCHSVGDNLRLSPLARALLAELMLRGPQTATELKNRGERMISLPDLAAVEEGLKELLQFGPPLVVRLPREAGRKEQRYAHLLSGMPELPEAAEYAEGAEGAGFPEEGEAADRPVERRRPSRVAETERLIRLEEEVGTLRDDVAALRREMEEFIAAFK